MTNQQVYKFKTTISEHNQLMSLLKSGELEKKLGVPVGSLQVTSIPQTAPKPNLQGVINLGEILQQRLQEGIISLTTTLQELGCTLIDNVFEPPYIDSQLAYAYSEISDNRSFRAVHQHPSIQDLIVRLENTENEDDRLLLAKRLAEVCSPKPEIQDSEEEKNRGKERAIATLINIIENTNTKEIRWQAIEYLSLISPEDVPPNIIAFCENIGVIVTDIPLKLFVGTAKLSNGKLNVFLRLYPQNLTENLPQGIKLIILDENGIVFKKISNDEPTKALMYKFSLSSGDRFMVRITLNNNSFTTRTYIG